MEERVDKGRDKYMVKVGKEVDKNKDIERR